MAHDIEIVNGTASMAYFGKTPWHGLGTPLEESDLYDWTSTAGRRASTGRWIWSRS